MSRIWSQLENISKTTEAQTRLRRNLCGFGMPATKGFFGFSDCLENRIESSTVKTYLPGLPKTADHQQLKI